MGQSYLKHQIRYHLYPQSLSRSGFELLVHIMHKDYEYNLIQSSYGCTHHTWMDTVKDFEFVPQVACMGADCMHL